jgi:hypothetical protein
VGVALLAGCAGLPTAGSVQAGREGAGGEELYVRAFAAGPAPGASLDQIVEGFLQAMLAGATDDFKVARSYLADGIAGVWDPSASVTVYQSGEAPVLAEAGTQLGRMTMAVTQVGQVDRSGRYSALDPQRWTEAVGLTQNDDSEWRIAEVPDGTVIPEDVFRTDYLATPLYFPSADGQYLVPDRRVFPRQSAATEAVRQFLDGPPPYLASAVGAVVPPGAHLVADAVKVTNGVAAVNLSGAMSRASETARATVLACLNETLLALPDVLSVELQIEGVPIEVEQRAGLAVDPASGGGPLYLADGGIWLQDASGGPTALAGTEPADVWQTLTADHTMKRFAGLNGGEVTVIAKAGAEPVAWDLPEGRKPTAPPAFDRLGSLWAASGDQVVAFDSDGAPTVLGATWLEGSKVTALAASRDGSRLALAMETPGVAGVRIAVSGIARGQAGVPWRLTGPLELGSVEGPVSSLSWADSLTVAMLARSAAGAEPAPALFTVGGDRTFLKPPVDPPVSLASGRGADEVYAAGKAGGLFAYSARGRVWTSLAGGAKAVALAP